jgi:UDP-N-acetylmuramoyl-L-alanyl-D-glutamate--2,6-diaminopimelate ligase
MEKLLKDILYKVSLEAVAGPTDILIDYLCFDSRNVRKGALFFAIEGTQADGHAYIDQAVQNGASAIVHSKPVIQPREGATYVQVKDTSRAMGLIAANFFDNPSAKLKVVGVTGTNGKTSTVTMLYRLFRQMGYGAGMLSTVQNRIMDEVLPSTHTTPDAIQIQQLMAQMVQAGCSYCFMEVSSHALVQERTAGIHFTGGVFTNISHDHLDFHKTFENYIAAKKRLFDLMPSGAWVLTNVDDKRGLVMTQNTRASIHTYSLTRDAAFKARVISHTMQGLELDIEGRQVWFGLTGRFNAYNVLCVYSVARLLEMEAEEVLTQLSLVRPAAGRFDQLQSSNGIFAIVDYAHTPDALEKVLETITELRTRNEQVITVVGCGGNRDAEKRPIMATLAARFSDRVILTSDNPRFENPETILDEMMKGITASEYRKVLRITDRQEAIRAAVQFAKPGDILLIAGKGHEKYQEIQGIKHPFDDKALLQDLFQQL